MVELVPGRLFWKCNIKIKGTIQQLHAIDST